MPVSLLNRRIGSTPVSAIGLGTAYYGASEPDEQRFKVLDAAYEEGCTLWDTADICSDSEDFIGKWCVLPVNLHSPVNHDQLQVQAYRKA